MNRKEKRALRHDKDLVKELYAIINKYLPDLLSMFNNLKDIRNKSYITYEMKTICVTRLFGLLCGLTTMSDISNKMDSYFSIKNISKICGQNLNELPYWETIQDVFININLDELKNIQKYIVKTLIRSKKFDKYKFKGCFQLVFDGTGLSNHDYNLNDNCLKRKHKDGKISYYKYVLECKLIVGNIIISLDSEFIENQGFYTQKHRTFDITHLNSRNDNAMKCHYFFIQFAHTIRQLLEQGNLLTKSLNLKIKEVSAILLKTLTSTISNLNNLEINFQLRFDT